MRVEYHARCLSRRSLFVLVHVALPSDERNTPPESASTIAQILLELLGDTASPMLPMTPAARPGFRVSAVQCSPPSVGWKIRLPAPPDASCHGVRHACQKAA